MLRTRYAVKNKILHRYIFHLFDPDSLAERLIGILILIGTCIFLVFSYTPE